MQEYEKSKVERYAERWLIKNGFSFEVLKHYISKTVYLVRKDGIETKFELPSAVTDPKGYMKLFGDSFEMKKNIEQMKKELKQMDILSGGGVNNALDYLGKT